MQRIQKAPETMTARERVRRTFEFEKTDRVTIGYEANAAIHARLCRELDVANDDMESVYQALGVDYRGVSAPYVGPELYKAPPERRVDPLEGCVMRWVAHETGGYWDFCDFPWRARTTRISTRFPCRIPTISTTIRRGSRRRATAVSTRCTSAAPACPTSSIPTAASWAWRMCSAIC